MMAILALYIILGLIAVIYILLRFSVRISYSFDTTSQTKAKIKIKYFFFTVYENPKSQKQKLRKEKKEKKKDKKSKSKKSLKTNKQKQKKDKSPDIVDEINSLNDEETKEKIKSLEREIEDQRKALLQTEIEISKQSLDGNTKAENKQDKQKKHSKQEKKELKKLKKQEKEKNKLLKKKNSKLKQLKQKWNFIKPYVPLMWNTLRKLLKKIRFYNTEIDIMLGNEDPYKAALNYGYFNTAFYHTLAFLCMVFSVKIKSCDINTEFIVKKFELKVSGDVYIRISTVLAIAICLLFKMLKIYLKQRNNQNKEKN